MSTPRLTIAFGSVTIGMEDNADNRFAAVKALLSGLPPAQVGQFLIDLYEGFSAQPEPIPVPDASDSDFGAFQEAGGAP